MTIVIVTSDKSYSHTEYADTTCEYKVCPDAAKLWASAQLYLNGSDTAKSIINSVRMASTKVYVLAWKEAVGDYSDALGAKFWSSTEVNKWGIGVDGCFITWNPKRGKQLLDNTYQSPALTLLHEFGHFKQRETRGDLAYFTYISSNNNANEEDNIAKYEKPVAQELGEGTRDKYVYRQFVNYLTVSTK
jgi:hypothetical protein